MKRIVSLILVIVMVLALAACGKSEAATAVDNLITSIGTVTLDNESAVAGAEAAYAALTQDQKEEVENYAILVAARTTLDALHVKAAAADLDALVEAIGTVTLDSSAAIAAAREAYNAADAKVQENVSKLAALEAAEAEYTRLETEQKQEQADAVAVIIDAIGEVSLDSSDAITAAQEAYNALPSDVKTMVSNADVLTAAAADYKSLRVAEAKKLLANMTCEEDLVRGINFYYPSAFPYYHGYGYWGADVRSFALPYLGVQGDYAWLRLVCDYTSDDWIFFEKITFAVDDERYYKFFSYYDVVRDNAYGTIWEYVDIEVGEAEIELLRAIADSERTIIRFEGDDYYDDITVSSSDKQAIKQMLEILEAFS